MARYDTGRGRNFDPRRSSPWGYQGYDRPWTGGYREGYQGGMGGIDTRTPQAGRNDARDWWMGGDPRQRNRGAGEYDRAYRRFDRESQPRFSPISGNYHAQGGRYSYRRPARPLAYDQWMSDWTRWF